ncbi:MAG: hypothetical protein E7G03_11660 [Bacteroides caccae]|jgi:hypothetical protein|nr:hypothetical protein [Bacteroides caccae]MDU3628437.1 hypothetical protein [Bacteroides caccae]MDU3671022.1 hypothetical protein [Bacteroides caccae]
MDERIISMIPQYGELNRIYTDILSGKGFSFEKQKFISDFYRQHEDTQAFETSLIGMVFETDAERRSLLLNSLKREIESNISIYNVNQLRFDNIDTWLISRDHADRFDWSIANQMKTTREYNKELMEANGSLEAMVYRVHDRQEEELLNRRYERCKREYEKEKAKLDELYDKKKQAAKEALSCSENRFKNMYELGCNLLAILEKYMTDQKRKETDVPDVSATVHNPDAIPQNQSAYFSMKLVSAVHEVCNGEQFEDISEADFYANMNLQPNGSKLKIRPREKARVCYLIFLMGETLPKQERENWKRAFMELLGIEENYYKSKYKEPASDFPSDANQEFAKKMKTVFR